MYVEMAQYLRKYIQKFGERIISMKCHHFYGALSGDIQFLIFEKFDMVFRWGWSSGWNVILIEAERSTKK